MTVYLPTEDQCDTFLKKTKRHALYTDELQQQRQQKQQIKNNENTFDSYDLVTDCAHPLVSSVQSSTTTNTISSISASESSENQLVSQPSPSIIPSSSTLTTNVESQDLSSRMSYEDNLSTVVKNIEPIKLIEDHFKRGDSCNEKKKSEMETSFDEGIGSTGSLSNHNVPPSSMPKLSPISYNEREDDDHLLLLAGSSNSREEDLDRFDDEEEADLDVNIDDNEINNLDDDIDFNNDGIIGDDQSDTNNCNNNNEEEMFETNNNDNMCSSSGGGGGRRTCVTTDDFVANLNKEFKASKYNKVKFADYINNEPSWDDEITSPNTSNNQQMNSSNLLPGPTDFGNHYNYDYSNEVDDTLPSYSELKDKMSRGEVYISSDKNNCAAVSNTSNSSNRFIKSTLTVNSELGTRTLDIKMDKRIDLNEFKEHIDEYVRLLPLNFRVFRMCPNDMECELTSIESQFLYLSQNSKFVIKLGPPLKYGEYVLPLYKLNKAGSFTYLCDFMIVHGLDVLNHKILLSGDLKDECGMEIPAEKIRLRRKVSKRPNTIYLDEEVFGVDIFVNTLTELCIEILDEPETKTSKSTTSVYLRHWKPDEYELGELVETLVDGTNYDSLMTHISKLSGIASEHIEVLKCKTDFPYKSAILNLHKDVAWKENYFLTTEKLEDGQCFYYRNHTLKLGTLSDEKRRDLEKEDNLNFRPTFSLLSKKEKGIKIHVDSV